MKCNCADYATIPLRLVIAVVFIYHGLTKLIGISGVIGFFGSVNIPLPAFAAYLVAIIELVGGIAILFGIWTRTAAALLAIVMVVALLAVKLKSAWPAGEIDLVLLGVLVTLMMTGAGKWAMLDDCCMCSVGKKSKK